MSICLLLDQIKSQNARKIESALYALRLFGLYYTETIEIIIKHWSVLSELQKELILLVVYRLVFDGVNSEMIYDFLEQENLCCNVISSKIYCRRNTI